MGDIHTEAAALLRSLEALSQLGVDAILATGDIVDGPLGAHGVEQCCQLLRQFEVTCVCGNHERWLQEGTQRDLVDAILDPLDLSPLARAYLHSLPTQVVVPTVAGNLLLCHGLGEDDMGEVGPYARGHELTSNEPLQYLIARCPQRMIIHGHSHRAQVRTYSGLTLVNAGTLLRTHQPRFVLIDLEAATADFYPLSADLTVLAKERVSLGG